MGRSSKIRSHRSYTQCDSCLRQVPTIHINRHRAQCSSDIERYSSRFCNTIVQFQRNNEEHNVKLKKKASSNNTTISSSSYSQLTTDTRYANNIIDNSPRLCIALTNLCISFHVLWFYYILVIRMLNC